MSSNKFLAGFLASSLLFPALLPAQVYKVEQEDGTVLYTDEPRAEGEEVVLDETTANTVPKLDSPDSPPPQDETATESPSIRIVSPEPEATIRNNQGNLSIEAQAANNAKGRYQLWFDGSPVQTNTSGRFSLSGVNRGAHTYQVHLLNNKGKTLASTQTQTLYLHQASALINQ